MPMKTVSALTFLLGVGLVGVHLSGKQRPGPEELADLSSDFQRNTEWQGRPAPEFEVELLDGATFRLSEHVGREVVILNFFATWCRPCRVEMPELGRFLRAMSGRPVRLIAIDAQEKSDLVQTFVAELGVSLPVAIDYSGAALKSYAVDSFPTTVVIGADGTVKLYQVGPVLNADVAFGELLEEAFADIAAGRGIRREDFLLAEQSAARPSAAPSREPPLTARGARIASTMKCPCGCCDHQVSTCACVTARGIRRRLSTDATEGKTDDEIIRELRAEFLDKGM